VSTFLVLCQTRRRICILINCRHAHHVCPRTDQLSFRYVVLISTHFLITKLPGINAFSSTDRSLGESGTFAFVAGERRRKRSVRTPEKMTWLNILRPEHGGSQLQNTKFIRLFGRSCARNPCNRAPAGSTRLCAQMRTLEQRSFATGFSGFCIDLQVIFSFPFPVLFTEEAKPYCDGLATFNN